jgi:MIP family channel proteins
MSSEPGLARRCTAELLGTFMFVFVGAGSAVAAQYLFSSNTITGFVTDPRAGLLVGALANGIGLAVAISATMAISGGHLNPAVTIGLLIGKKVNGKDVIPYIVSQLVGAIIAVLLLITVLPSNPGKAVGWGAPYLNIISVAQGTVFELVMTFFLVLGVYGTAVDKRGPKIGGFGIGLIVLVDVLVGGPFTGAAMNPARAMGPMIAGLVTGVSFPSYWYIYWIGPLIGAALAGLVYSQVLENKSMN